MRILAVIWAIASLLGAFIAAVATFRCAARGNWPYVVLLATATVFLAVANPLINTIVFARYAEKCREEMLATAKAEHCVGRPDEWLTTRFGKPHLIYRDPEKAVDHWWYTPGPSFIVHEDYVGFEVVQGKITNAYMQIN